MSEINKDLTQNGADSAEETKKPADSGSAEAKKAEKPSDGGRKKKKKTQKTEKSGGIKAFFKSRKARHGSVAIAIVAVVIAVVIILNVICSLLVDRFPNIVLDLTSDNSFALEDDTIDYVSHLDKDVTVTVLTTEEDFEGAGSYYLQANNLLEKMESQSNGKVTLDYINLTNNPSFVQKYTDADWNSGNNVMVVECGDQYRVLDIDDCFEYDATYYSYYGSYYITGSLVEQAVVTAILNVTTEDKVLVDIITGNQEQDYTAIKNLLQNNAYDVNEISLLTSDIDEDAQFILLFAPSVDLDETATDKISSWLDNDGNFGRSLIYIPSEDNVDTPNIDALLDEWGMEVDDGYAFETNTNYLVSSQSAYVFTVDYTDYYTDGLKNPNIPVVTLYARDIKITDENTAHGLLSTSASAGVREFSTFDTDEEWDYQDSLSDSALNIAAEGVKTNSDSISSHVVVFGSYTMFAEQTMSYNSYNNSAYFMNLVNTIADRDEVGITIESKSLESGELGITDVTTKNIIFVVFVILVPVAVLVIGLVMWLRRRNK